LKYSAPFARRCRFQPSRCDAKAPLDSVGDGAQPQDTHESRHRSPLQDS
jgi:hypothetical protein